MEKRENILEIDQTWKRMEDVSKKTGLREGISSGRESNFQEYFDIGYKEGFKNGYALGKCKGALTANSRQRSSELENYSTLDKTRRARCEICKDERLLEENVPEIIKKQKEVFRNDLQKLYSTLRTTYKDFDQNFDVPVPTE